MGGGTTEEPSIDAIGIGGIDNHGISVSIIVVVYHPSLIFEFRLIQLALSMHFTDISFVVLK